MPTRAKPETSETPTVEEAGAAAAVAEQVFGDDLAAKPVVVKLARIMASLPELKPEGKNLHFSYNFIKDTQVSGALRPRMAAERLMIIPDVLSEERIERAKSTLTKLHVQFTIIDGDSGDSISGIGIGYGDDSGDKGANKALTAAMKYWLIKLFQIGGEDLEDDQRADLRAAAREAGTDRAIVETKVGTADAGDVAKGGKQDRISAAQLTQLFALYKDLELTPETFADRFDTMIGIPLNLDPEGDVTTQLNQAVKALTGDEAGEFLSKLVDERDAKTADGGSGSTASRD